ncbi:MAG: GIY-YIG nuclease family protein [Candidatus Wallbacteria bacterium]|nr:GIY-YIG nuclease family protein [Candidatus Wallbacteria bacterium]
MRKKKTRPWFLYIVRCNDGTLYTGIALDPEIRIAAHNSGKGAKYTRCRLPVELVYLEKLPTQGEAMKRECNIKRLGKNRKEALILEAQER